MNIVEEALKWAKRGVPVFPCSSDKSPLTAHGHLDATTDPEQIRFLFEGNESAVLIGARMGQESGLFAIDFDLYKPGAEQYMQSLSDKGLLNSSQIHTTQSGGIHILYRGEGEYPNCKPALGVEVKGEGGYIIVPPSPGYAIQETGIAYANPELIKELLSAKKESSSATVDSLKRLVLSGKAFHDPLAQIAARRAAQGWPIERVQREIYEVLGASAAQSAEHDRHERWSALMQDGGYELSRIVGSGNDKFNPNRHTEKARDSVSDSLHRELASASENLFSRGNESDSSSTESGSEDTKGAIPYQGTAWPFAGDGYFSRTERNIFDQRYIAYPLFAENESVLIASEPKTGKTAIALKLAMQVAYGESLGNDFQVTDASPVLYFTLEGVRAVQLRVKAELDRRKEEGLPDTETDNLFIVERPHNFGDARQRQENCAKIALHDVKCREDLGKPLGLIIIDTLTKAMPGKDQNSVEDTSELFELIGQLRQLGVTATVVFIHHLSKQGGVRGSTNIEAEVDVVLGVRKDKKSGIVHMDIWRARSMDEECSYAFTFDSRYLGETTQGHKLHAPIVNLITPDVDTSGITAAAATKWAKLMDSLIEQLGAGTHDIADLIIVVGAIANVTPPKGKRPNYKTKLITAQLKDVFQDKLNWSYGNYIFKLRSDTKGFVTGLTILEAK